MLPHQRLLENSPVTTSLDKSDPPFQLQQDKSPSNLIDYNALNILHCVQCKIVNLPQCFPGKKNEENVTDFHVQSVENLNNYLNKAFLHNFGFHCRPTFCGTALNSCFNVLEGNYSYVLFLNYHGGPWFKKWFYTNVLHQSAQFSSRGILSHTQRSYLFSGFTVAPFHSPRSQTSLQIVPFCLVFEPFYPNNAPIVFHQPPPYDICLLTVLEGKILVEQFRNETNTLIRVHVATWSSYDFISNSFSR